MRRTDRAEIFLEHFTARPLTFECVYRNPKYLPDDKELCDHILLLRNAAIVASLKCQEDPTQRTGGRLQNWAEKAARKAVKQAKGALRSLRTRQCYCQHPRRGRVDFQPGSLRPQHMVILVEALE